MNYIHERSKWEELYIHKYRQKYADSTVDPVPKIHNNLNVTESEF